jgi:hypothetical protein
MAAAVTGREPDLERIASERRRLAAALDRQGPAAEFPASARAVNVGVVVRLLDEHGNDLGMIAHIPPPIEIADLAATERETFRIVDIAPSYSASVIAARCRVTPEGLHVAAR